MRMSSGGRMTTVVALVIVLAAAGYALMPFTVAWSPAFGAGHLYRCGAPIVEAWQSPPKGLLRLDSGSPCSPEAKRRAASAGIVVFLAVVGGVAAAWILRPAPDR